MLCTSETFNFNKCSTVAKVTPADLGGMDNLTVLYLHDNAVMDMGTSLKALKSLTLLDISGNKLTKVIVCICVFAIEVNVLSLVLPQYFHELVSGPRGTPRTSAPTLH